MGIAGNIEKFADFAREAEIPASLCKGALEALGGQLEAPRDILTRRKRGVDMPLKVNRMGH